MTQESLQITRNRRTPNSSQNSRFERRVVRDIHNEFRKSFESINQDSSEITEELNGVAELEEIASMEVDKPSFPIILFSTALFFDLVDIGQLSGVWWFVMFVINFGFGVYLFFWMSGKLSSLFRSGSKGLFKTKLGKRILIKTARKFLTKRLALFFILNIIPFIGILASNAWFVFLAHNHMNKIAKMYIDLIENTAKKLKEYKRSSRN